MVTHHRSSRATTRDTDGEVVELESDREGNLATAIPTGEQLLTQILSELKKLNFQLALVTDFQFGDEEQI